MKLIRKYYYWILLVYMSILTIYSLSMSTDDKRWYILSAGIIAAVMIVSIFLKKIILPVRIVLLFLYPAGVFALVENMTHPLSKMWEGPIKLNLIFYYLFFIVLFALVGRAKIACWIGTVVIAFCGLVNYFVILFRSSPVLPWDFYSMGVAASVADNYQYVINVRCCNVLLLLLLMMVLAGWFPEKISSVKIRLGLTALSLVALLLFARYIQTDQAAKTFKMDTTLFTPNVLYRNNGLMVAFIANMKYLFIEKPDSYSVEEIQELQKQIGDEHASQQQNLSDQKPNIIVVMNEAFSDLAVLGEVKTNVDYMPFIHSLSENTQKGWVYTSVKGGNTANTEYEFLTGNSMYFMPVGSVVYQQYLRDDMPSLCRQLSFEGYTSIAVHPYYGSGWNREKVYDYFGFDEKIFKNNFTAPEILRTYVSDQATYDKIIERYEKKSAEDRLFVFDVTMQNHGSYVKRFDNFVPDVQLENGTGSYVASTEQYLSLIKRSDEAFENLVKYFEQQEEPVLILMFGDHQPADYIARSIWDGKEDTPEAVQKRYIVPYVMWANYPIEEKESDILSVNYLAGKVLETAGIRLTDYQYFLKQLSDSFPVVNAIGAMDDDGAFLERDDQALKESLLTYQQLQYQLLTDQKNRWSSFYNPKKTK